MTRFVVTLVWAVLAAWIPTSVAYAGEPPPGETASGGVSAFVAVALEQSPQVRAAFERWQAQVHRVARQRMLPEPTLTFAAFVQSVETRVGPQQARVSVQQAFPWPTRLTAGGKAAAAEARAAEALMEATSLAVADGVEQAYWLAWEVRATRTLHADHLAVLTGLSETVGARLAVGGATLADLQQVDLSRSRLEDRLLSMDEAELAAIARLRASIGDRNTTPLATTTQPILARPRSEDLADQVLRNPRLTALEHGADAADARARSAGASRLPSFTVGADWILTGPSTDSTLEDNGKDALVAGVGLRVPLWQGVYRHDVAAERAMAGARRADQLASGDQLLAAAESALAELRDTQRRVRVLTGTLLPQAEAAYSSVLGSYASGSGSVAQVLLGQRDLLELGVERVTASARHQRAWARLDRLVGTEVERVSVDVEQTP